MPIQNTNRSTTWTINDSDKTWTLTKNATISVDNGSGIYESGQNGNIIKVLGDIKVSGMAFGVSIEGTDSEVNVGQDAHINAKLGVSGIYSGAAGAHIVNRGLVQGETAAIQGAIWSNIENYGVLRSGQYGILQDGEGSQIYNYGKIDGSNHGVASGASGTYVENAKGAEISGDNRAIFLDGNGEAEIVNRGVLRSNSVAIETEDSVATITNTGKIFGDVWLDAGDDTFDSRKGSVKGEVSGGLDDDDYYVGASRIRIVEGSGANSGYDEVFSTVSHKLADNVEALHLLGKGDTNATGNSVRNALYGNQGDNVLKGGGNIDYLRGLGGDDTLTGGTSKDFFIFNRAGVDRITDFTDGLDEVVIAGIDSQAEFDALNIKQINGDTVINFGGGDKIVIEDLLKTDFTYSDDVSVIV